MQKDTKVESVICAFTLVPPQDEQYEHLDELEVMKVEKQVNEAMNWMNNKMNEQSKQNLTLNPVIKACEIQAKTKVLITFYMFLKQCFILLKLKSKPVFQSFLSIVTHTHYTP